MKQKIISFLALFTSSGTLLCCALPATIAAIAGGAAVGAFVSAFPWLITLSKYKAWLFLIAGLLIALNGTLVFRPQGTLACTLTGGKGCEIAGKFTRAMFWLTVSIYAVGVIFAYALVPLLKFFEG